MSLAATLFDAIRHADLDGARSALAADPGVADATDEGGVSALMTALYYRQREIAEAIADVRTDLDIFEVTGLGRREELEAVLGRGLVDLAATSPDGFTALHYAAFFGHADLVSVLVAAGAPVGAVAANPTRVQPLHSAVAARSPGSVRRLLDAGADPNARQQQGYTPIQGAAHAGDLESVDALLGFGADPDLTNDEGKSARDLAHEAGHDAVVSRFS